MKFRKFKTNIPLLLISMAWALTGKAQSQCNASHTINSGSGSFANNQYSIDWSIGELIRVDSRLSDDKKFLVTSGILQPVDYKSGYLVNDPGFSESEVKILPNPVKTVLKVQVNVQEKGDLSLVLYSQGGVRIFQNKLKYFGYGYTETIDMRAYAQGSYFLFVEMTPFQGPKYRRGTFKIIKAE